MDSEWYKNWFGNEYLNVYAHRDLSEAKSLIKLILSHYCLNKSDLVLDLCCGQGRHVNILSRMGFKVVGMDLSKTLLNYAKHKNQGPNSWFVQTDMRNLPARNKFSLVLNLFTSFGYFEEDAENMRVFRQFEQVLIPNGNFVFDYFNAIQVEASLVPEEKLIQGRTEIQLSRNIENGRVNKLIQINKMGEKSQFYESVRMYHPDQIFDMLTKSGLRPKFVFGNYDGSAFKLASPRLLIIGEKNDS